MKAGVVSVKEYEDLFFTDDVDAAYLFVTGRLQTSPNEPQIDENSEVPKII